MYNVNTHFPDLPRSKVDFLRFVQRLRTFRESTSDAIVIHCRLVGGLGISVQLKNVCVLFCWYAAELCVQSV